MDAQILNTGIATIAGLGGTGIGACISWIIHKKTLAEQNDQFIAELKQDFIKPEPRFMSRPSLSDVWYEPEYLMSDILGPQGWHQVLNSPSKVRNVNAGSFGFNQWSHNGHKGGMDSETEAFRTYEYDASFNIVDATAFLTASESFYEPLPKIWQWYQTIRTTRDGAYTISRE